MGSHGSKNVLMAAYALFALGLFFPLLTIVGVIISHLKASGAGSRWEGSHFRWLKRTFWFGLLWSVIAAVVMLIPVISLVAWVLLVAVAIWYIYRVVRGGLNMFDEKPMY